ncbi:MAG TPA: hypothetical protein VFB80_19290 [Pirellulaceae bacterium]|nr:hypothetical protein [Pirellulaceae bacterium]
MPAVYENLGVRLLYPENWSITDEEDDGWPRSVTIQSQDTGFWSLHVYPAGQKLKPVVDELVAAISDDFGEVEVLPAEETFGDTVTTGVDLAFFYLDLLVEAKIRCVRTPSCTLVWLYQAESREFEAQEPVFQAMAVSMLQTQVAVKSGR